MIEAIEMATSLIGCSKAELASRTIEENLALCAQCGILSTCPYPASVTTKMVKSATEEKPNLKKQASESATFAEFHGKHTQNIPRNTLQETFTKRQTSRRTKKNLKEIARDSLSFTDYRNRAHGDE
jgi:hypothetical protein